MYFMKYFILGVDFKLSLKIMLLFSAWYGIPYWKYLKSKSNFGRATLSRVAIGSRRNCSFSEISEKIYIKR